MPVIPAVLDIAAQVFDKVPLLNKLKGYRSAIGLALLAVCYGLDAAQIGPGTLAATCGPSLLAFTGLALNAAGR